VSITVPGRAEVVKMGSQKPPNKRQLSKEATRERILKAAIDVFYEKGYLAVNVAEIASTAKVSVGAVFFHFNDKRTLFLSTIREANSRYLTRLEEAIDRIAHSRRGVVEKMEVIAQSHLKIALAYTEFYSNVIHEMFIVDLEFEFVSKEMSQSIIVKLEKLIRKGIEEGVICPDANIDVAASLLFHIPMITLSQRELVGGTRQSLETRCAASVRCLMSGIVKSPGQARH